MTPRKQRGWQTNMQRSGGSGKSPGRVCILRTQRGRSGLADGEGVALGAGVLPRLADDNLVPFLTLRASSEADADIRETEIKTPAL